MILGVDRASPALVARFPALVPFYQQKVCVFHPGEVRSCQTDYHRHRAGGERIDRPRVDGETGDWLVGQRHLARAKGPSGLVPLVNQIRGLNSRCPAPRPSLRLLAPARPSGRRRRPDGRAGASRRRKIDVELLTELAHESASPPRQAGWGLVCRNLCSNYDLCKTLAV